MVIDDDEDILTSATLFLKQYFKKVRTLNSPTNVVAALSESKTDLVLLDMNYRRGDRMGSEGLSWLARILDFDSSILVLPMTAYAEVDLAVQAVKQGAYDFITKPWQNEKLLTTLSAAIQLKRSKLEIKALRKEQSALKAELSGPFADFIGKSPAILKVKETIQKVGATDANVLITGENGTGKEVVARALHKASARKNMPFVSVDLGAIPETLFESELFGVKKGAFTDASTDRLGRFGMADKGTLFLDEIGNLQSHLQAKLLNVLETQQLTSLGDSRAQQIDIRIVAATNTELSQAVEEGRFRQDLLYRINTVQIELPPLRNRADDIQDLANHFLSIFSRKYQRPKLSMAAHALRDLKSYHWPGNIRELAHALERAVILSDSNVLQASDFALKPKPVGQVDTLNLEEMEKQLIIRAVNKHKGNISRAANELGLTRTALYRRLEKHGI